MIDLTPLDIRGKRGDFKKKLGGGYDPAEVDVFLELVAERLEEVVRDNLQYRERAETLGRQVASQSGREQAVQEALVTAQELRTDIRDQAQREADHLIKEAETEGRRLVAEAQAEVRRMVRDAERRLEQGQDALQEMERRRARFLKSFRQLLEREMDVVEVEESQAPLEERAIELDLGGSLFGGATPAAAVPKPEPSALVESAPEVPISDADAPSLGSALAAEPAPAVDFDPAARPPMDAPVDQLADGYVAPEGVFGTEPTSADGPSLFVEESTPPAQDPAGLLFSFDGEDGTPPSESTDDDDRLY